VIAGIASEWWPQNAGIDALCCTFLGDSAVIFNLRGEHGNQYQTEIISPNEAVSRACSEISSRR
jgi:hypothetical protein